MSQVLLAKASRNLAAKEVDAAAAVYKGFERRGAAGIPAAAATNLSFLYLLEGDLTSAAHYTDLALKADRCASLLVRTLTERMPGPVQCCACTMVWQLVVIKL